MEQELPYSLNPDNSHSLYLDGTRLDSLHNELFESYVLFVPKDSTFEEIAESWHSLNKMLNGNSLGVLDKQEAGIENSGEAYQWKIMVASEDESKISRMYEGRHKVHWETGTKLGHFIQDCLVEYSPKIGSDYREILERAILEGHAYKMAQNGKGWTFEQVKEPEYTELAKKYGIIHPKLGKVNLEKVNA